MKRELHRTGTVDRVRNGLAYGWRLLTQCFLFWCGHFQKGEGGGGEALDHGMGKKLKTPTSFSSSWTLKLTVRKKKQATAAVSVCTYFSLCSDFVPLAPVSFIYTFALCFS